MSFRDRRDAGRQLARHLAHLRGQAGIVLGIPRGGVVVARPVADALGWPLDVVIARKVGAPFHPELALGAVAPGDVLVINEAVAAEFDLTPEDIAPQVAAQRAEIERRLGLYRGNRPAPDVHGKTLVVVDDGIATGMTVAAAIQSLRRQEPKAIVLAAPVASPEAMDQIRPLVDAAVCLLEPWSFRAVGEFYEDFTQVTDDEVIRLLEPADETG